jgi:nucleoside-diphosphate-sugar epimerase
MKTVVTGAAGFIGANLVRRLIQLGRNIRCVDNISRGKSRNPEGLPVDIVYADLRRYDQALEAVDGADVVYHLAARVGSIDFVHGTSKKIEIWCDKSKPVGPLSWTPSTSKARQILGWSATSSLEIGIRKTFDWMKQQDAPTLTRGYGLRLNK